MEAQRNFKPGTLAYQVLGASLRARAGSDAELQAQCLANAWLSLDEKEILTARSAFPSFGLDATLTAIEREAARSPYVYDHLCLRAGSELLHVQNAVAACGGTREFFSYSRKIAKFPSPQPAGFYPSFFASFAERFDVQLSAKQGKELIRQENRRLDSESALARNAALSNTGRAVGRSIQERFSAKPTAPAAPEKSPQELRHIFLEANPDLSQRLEAAESREKDRLSYLHYVAELGPHDEPARGYPLRRPWDDELPEPAPGRTSKAGHATMPAPLKNELDLLGASFKVGASPKRGGPTRQVDRLPRPLASTKNAFTLPASLLLEAPSGATHGPVMGRIQKDFERAERNFKSLSEFSTACQAYAYATGYRHREPKPLGRMSAP